MTSYFLSFGEANPSGFGLKAVLFIKYDYFSSSSRSFNPSGPFCIACSTLDRIAAGIFSISPAIRFWAVTVELFWARVLASAAWTNSFFILFFSMAGTGAWFTDCSRACLAWSSQVRLLFSSFLFFLPKLNIGLL